MIAPANPGLSNKDASDNVLEDSVGARVGSEEGILDNIVSSIFQRFSTSTNNCDVQFCWYDEVVLRKRLLYDDD